MPTYQYVCTACGQDHEAVQRFTDAPLTNCPACDGRLRKVFSPVGVVFKGSGFYKTDSRGAKAGAAKPDGGSAEGGKGDGGKADSGSATPAKADSGASSSGGAAAPSGGSTSSASSASSASAPASKSA